jgi:thiol:disulfide interchange protein DsbD
MLSFVLFLSFVAIVLWAAYRKVGLLPTTLAIGAVLVALSAWMFGRFVQASGPGHHRALAALLSGALLVAALWLAWPREQAADAAPAAQGPSQGSEAAAWQPWSEARVAQSLAQGRAVFVDFTAAWCVTCQVNKKLVLERGPVVSAMRQSGVLRLRADWTNRDPAITAALARHGRNGVPLYLLYVPGASQPKVLPEILTAALVMDALAALR